MAEITKQALTVENNQSFPNNNNGQITPDDLRTFNQNMIDSLVDEITYNADSASWNEQLDNVSTGSVMVTGSVDNNILTFVKGNGSTFSLAVTASVGSVEWDNVLDKPSGLVSGSSQVVDILTSVNSFTQSQESKDSTLATYTGSVDTKFSTIGTQSGSWDNTGLNAYTASNDTKWNTLGSVSGSWITNAQTSSMSVNYAVTSSKSQDLYVNCKNSSGAIIAKGSIVRITGASGDNPEIGLADWTNDGSSANTLGITTEAVAINAFTDVVVQGRVIGLSTEAFTPGQLIFLGPNGTIVASVPTPYHEVRLGQVLRSQINNGSIYLSIDNGYELSELHDVNIVTASLANNELLAYDSASQQWTNKTINSLGIPQLSTNNTFTGTNNSFQNISAVTASFGQINYVTGSAVIVGDSFIVLNTDTPTLRYAGLQVIDSGSGATASLQWDGDTDKWLVVEESGQSAYLLSGPTGSLGSEVSLTDDRIPKSGTGNQLVNSSISDNGTIVSINSNTQITGSVTQTGGTNTLNGATTINANTIIGNGGTLNVGSDIIGNAGLNLYNQYAGINIKGNAQGSGSQYPGVNLTVAENTYPTDIYGGYGILTEAGALAGSTFVGLAASTYSPQYGGTLVPCIIANGNNPGGNDTSIIWKADGTAEHWKKSDFKYGVDVSGSFNQTNGNVTITGSLSQQGGNTTLNGNLTVAGGNVYLTPLSVNANVSFPIPFISGSAVSKDSVDTLLYNPSSNALFVSASVGVARIATTAIAVSSGSGATTNSTSTSPVSIVQSAGAGRTIQLYGNPSLSGAPNLTTSTNPAILATSSSNFPYVAIELQASQSFTDGRVTIKRPLVVEQGITGSIVQGGGTNTFSGETTINANTIVGNGGTLNVGGQITGNSGLLLQSSGAGINIQSNTAGSGSAYTGVNIKVDNTTDPTNVYSSVQLIDDVTNYTLALAWNSYTPYYTNSTPMIVANAQYSGSDVAFAFPTNEIDVWKPMNAKYGVEVTGSLSVSGSINTSVIPLTITSNTASLNASTGNTFQLNLVSGSATRLEISGTTSGQTINLLVSQSATGPGTLVFGSGIEQPSGSFYSASQVASGEDILTMATFINANRIYVANVKNFI